MLSFIRSHVTLLQIIFCLLLAIYIFPVLDQSVLQFFYAVSLSIKELLMVFLPIAVFVYIVTAIATLGNKAPLFIVALCGFEYFSNFCAVLYAYALGNVFVDGAFIHPNAAAETVTCLKPLWQFGLHLPSFWTADKGVWGGIAIGVLFALFKREPHFLKTPHGIIDWIFKRVFQRLIPLFILGFLANAFHTGGLAQMAQYGEAVLISTAGVLFYIGVLFSAAASFKVKETLHYIKNAFPSFLMGLTSASSMATMPTTIACAMKSTQDPDFPKTIIPATTNIQQIGDSIINAFLCLVILKTFGFELPDILSWLSFAFVYAFARFATSAVMGGAIFIMLPIYERFLGFTPEMTAMILAMNVILDPIITATNIYANGALCLVFERFWNFVQRLWACKRAIYDTP